MNVGIVGSGADKFVPEARETAKALILELLSPSDAVLVSGRSPVGGIDVWAEETADKIARQKIIHAPKVEQWSPSGGRYGYKLRNIDIAKSSDIIHVIVVAEYPASYDGMRFEKCYHCLRMKRDATHVKSGGCWTAEQAIKMGKQAIWHVLRATKPSNSSDAYSRTEEQ